MTRIKIFTASGAIGIEKLEVRVNEWIGKRKEDIISITPCMCTVGVPEESFQCMTITVVYR